MPATIQHESGNTYRVHATGLLRVREMADVQERAAQAIRDRGKIKLLFVLDRFEGWERSAGWNDMSFYGTHGSSVEKIAIVGEEKWRDEALMFAGAGLRKAAVQYFETADDQEALAWLAQ
jgi:hypothetical protein